MRDMLSWRMTRDALAAGSRLLDSCTASIEIPCKTNPLGIKGVGEAGTIGAPPAVINAILDALAPYGVESIDMPATPSRIWGCLQKASHKRDVSQTNDLSLIHI